MPFVSQLLGKPVVDADGEVIGNLKELLGQMQGDVPLPKVVALQVKRGNRLTWISIKDVTLLIVPAIAINVKKGALIPYLPQPNDLYLVRDVLDKQIIDTNGVRVVRVNDLEISRVNEDYYISNVDISGAALMRRLGFGQVGKRMSRRAQRGSQPGTIAWVDVELISSDQPMRLKVPSEKLAELHPADIAEILSDLNRQEGREFLESLDLETLADTLEEVEPDFQASLLEGMPNERVADVLEEMEPDEAADLLAELPEERSQELLDLMEDDEAAEIRRLLSFPVDSAGGIMTTEFFTVPPELTAEQVIELLRAHADEINAISYVYVTDESSRLVGVFSLKDLVISKPDVCVADFMIKRVVSVGLEDSQDDCAQMIAKYDLMALPVVDEEKRLHGVVTADDALDKIIPTHWKKRLPRLYH